LKPHEAISTPSVSIRTDRCAHRLSRPLIEATMRSCRLRLTIDPSGRRVRTGALNVLRLADDQSRNVATAIHISNQRAPG
jgi:hypothetical protein